MDMRRSRTVAEAPPAVIPRDGYLEVHVRPDPGQPASKQVAVETVAAQCKARGAQRVLIVCEDPHPIFNKIDAYWVGEAIAIRLAGVRAAVYVPDRPIADLEDFTGQVARSRGAEFRFFADHDAALRWLLKDG
jgi:hypothetical protein